MSTQRKQVTSTNIPISVNGENCLLSMRSMARSSHSVPAMGISTPHCCANERGKNSSITTATKPPMPFLMRFQPKSEFRLRF